MPYRISGRDRITGKPITPYVSSAASEVEARGEATARGIEVESIEPLAAAPPPPAPVAEPTSTIPGYEFTRPQNEVIERVARYMNITGWGALVLGGLQLLIALMAAGDQGLPNFLQGALLMIVGFLTRRVAQRFRRIPATSGRDIAHLMDALTGLRTLYTFQVWMLGLAIAFIVLVILLAIGRS